MDYKSLKLYRLKSESASYDDAHEIVVWAHDEHDAREVLKEAFDSQIGPSRVEIPGSLGDPAWPYEVTEVACERGIVLAETPEG